MTNEPIKLSREVEAIQIPYGQKLKLAAGAWVEVTQLLGGNYTVMTDRGMLVRIDGKDADALGLQAQAAKPDAKADAPADRAGVEKAVWEQLKTCFDPEIPVNIVDLGLVYECTVAALPGGFGVEAKMTLTAPGCGMGPVLQQDAQTKIASIPGVKAANVEIVFEPPWDQSRMTEAAKLQLGML